MPPLLTISELANHLRCSTKTIRRKVAAGIIPAIQLGDNGSGLRFDLDEVLKAFKSRGRSVFIDQLPHKQNKKLSGPTPRWKTNNTK